MLEESSRHCPLEQKAFGTEVVDAEMTEPGSAATGENDVWMLACIWKPCVHTGG